MISRLLLVGMVGVLGISLPDGANLGSGLTWARTGATACACRRETVTFEPIAAVESHSTCRVADARDCQFQGVDLPAVSAVQDAARARPAASDPADVVNRLFAENRVWGEPAADPVAAKPSPPPDRRPHPEPAVDPAGEVDRLFAENRVWGEPAAEAVVVSPPPARETGPRFEPIAVAERGSSLADELNHASEGMDLASAVVPAPAPAPHRPRFEPIAVVDGSPSIADELNRASEGLSVVRDADPSLGNALRLTHDAAMAWLNVLTKTMPTSGVLR